MSQAMTETHVFPRVHYLNVRYGWKSWLFTTDHKRIAWLYLAAITFFFFVGGLAATLMRLNLIEPQGSLVEPSTYNRLFTLHGLVMIFFFLAPSIPAVLGNFLIPLMIGAKDVAFPKLNLLSWYIFMAGGTVFLYSVLAGGVDTGWTFYTPLSSTYANSNVMSAAMGVFISGFSSILTGLNFIVTIHTMRAPGLTWFRLPLFLWSMYATSIIFILAMPVIAITMVLLMLERFLHFGFFDPALGGDPILFQHLFWFFGHPEVYVLVLPAMGVISELIATFSRKRIFGYSFVAFSSVAIAALSFLVWGHHMFVSGEALYSVLVFVGFILTFGPQFILGYLGMPRRYAVYPPEFQTLNVLSSAGASILAVGYVIPLIYLIWSARYGPVVGPNPWGAKGLEWTTASPPPTENFEVTPVVTEEAYAFGTGTE